jgi:sec-independent protein translocase protein TatA
MGSLSISHWLIVLVVLLLLFGPKRLSEIGKGMGQGIKNFKSGLNEDDPSEAAAKKKDDRTPPPVAIETKGEPLDAKRDAASDERKSA